MAMTLDPYSPQWHLWHLSYPYVVQNGGGVGGAGMHTPVLTIRGCIILLASFFIETENVYTG